MTLKENIMKLQTYKMFEGEDTLYVERDDVLKLLEQEPKTEQFAKWVATEIFDEMWEYNKDAFAEIACRKLAKLGIVRAKGDEWKLIESKESDHTCHTCKHYTSGEHDGSCGSYICKGYSDWKSEDKE
jgi:hypothetical protein